MLLQDRRRYVRRDRAFDCRDDGLCLALVRHAAHDLTRLQDLPNGHADGARRDVIQRRKPTLAQLLPPARIVDPTGVGDAFRGGFMKGMAIGVDYVVSAKLGAVAAAYALEHLGGQSHAYSWEEFRERFDRTFGAHAGIE